MATNKVVDSRKDNYIPTADWLIALVFFLLDILFWQNTKVMPSIKKVYFSFAKGTN